VALQLDQSEAADFLEVTLIASRNGVATLQRTRPDQQIIERNGYTFSGRLPAEPTTSSAVLSVIG
jgi:hypothetical protein